MNQHLAFIVLVAGLILFAAACVQPVPLPDSNDDLFDEDLGIEAPEMVEPTVGEWEEIPVTITGTDVRWRAYVEELAYLGDLGPFTLDDELAFLEPEPVFPHDGFTFDLSLLVPAFSPDQDSAGRDTYTAADPMDLELTIPEDAGSFAREYMLGEARVSLRGEREDFHVVVAKDEVHTLATEESVTTSSGDTFVVIGYGETEDSINATFALEGEVFSISTGETQVIEQLNRSFEATFVGWNHDDETAIVSVRELGNPVARTTLTLDFGTSYIVELGGEELELTFVGYGAKPDRWASIDVNHETSRFNEGDFIRTQNANYYVARIIMFHGEVSVVLWEPESVSRLTNGSLSYLNTGADWTNDMWIRTVDHEIIYSPASVILRDPAPELPAEGKLHGAFFGLAELSVAEGFEPSGVMVEELSVEFNTLRDPQEAHDASVHLLTYDTDGYTLVIEATDGNETVRRSVDLRPERVSG